MDEQNRLQPNGVNLKFKKYLVIIIFFIIIAILIAGGAIYFWQNYKINYSEKNLQQENTLLQNQTAAVENQIQNIESNDSVEKDHEKPSQAQIDKWETYENSKLDIDFDYPSTWQPQEITNWGDGDFRLDFKTTELKQEHEGANHLHIVGINDKYIDEGHPGWFGYCAVSYGSIDEFCKDGCERLSSGVAIDFRSVHHGDSGFSAIAYTNLSQKYPSICFEFDLSQVLSEIAAEKGINYYDVVEDYNVKFMIANRDVSDSILKAVDNFKNFAKTIKSK